MSRFGPDPRAFFDSIYQGTAPWDVGGAPALAALFRDHPPTGPVLDVRCGSGDLAIHLAQAGLEVLGIDFSERAIARAWEKAAALPPDGSRSLEFVVADALRPSLLQRRFGAVVDSGFLHVLDRGDRDRFADELGSVLLQALRARFTTENDWRILEIGAAEFQTVRMPMPAVRACIQRLPAAG